MPKYYVMLVDLANQRMRVPVKALRNPYDGEAAYCAGMPQFFGGTDRKDRPPTAVMKEEVGQESRRTLELMVGPDHFFDSENMFFYWADADRWQETGTAWGPGRNKAEREMDRIEIVDLTRFNPQWSNDQLIAELIRQTNSEGAPQQGQDEFDESATREAFVELLRLLLG
ncbi:MAG TPA: hypothetical protein VGW40_04790 [Allosphingosinicella sp.]|nr:hypothetical protein [Allosphingosinicella sp.]